MYSLILALKTVNDFYFLKMKNLALTVFKCQIIIISRGMAMKTKEEIAKVLKEYRQRTGMSAKKVIEKLSLHGIKVSPKTLYGWESGHSQPNADTLLLLCDIYGVDDIMRAVNLPKS
jgi:predicted transcriptional regulator